MPDLSFDVKGVLPRQHIRDHLIERKMIRFQRQVSADELKEQLQPATLDTRLFGPIQRVAHFRPPRKNETVAEVLKNASSYKININENDPQPTERGISSYVVELNEVLALPHFIYGEADTRSGAGRNFLRCRLVTDCNPLYNKIPPGYEGKLYLEFTSMAFVERLRAGDRIEQLRFYNGDATISDSELFMMHRRETIAYDKEGKPMPENGLINGGIVLTADLSDEIIGYIPRFNDFPVDYGKKKGAPKNNYWIPITRPADGLLAMWQGQLAILPTYERPSIPHEMAAKMVQYDISLTGDDKTNEAGFFDNGYGKGKNKDVKGATAVLEFVVSHQPRTVKHREPIALLKAERTIDIPDEVYDGSYQGQIGPNLPVQFY